MVVAELLTKLGFTVDAREMHQGISQAKTALSGFKSFVGKLALGYGFFEIGKHVLNTARELETMTTQLHTMTGSTEKTNMLFKGIVDYAKGTSFYVKDVLAATTALMQGGVPSSSILGMVKQLGDISSNPENLERLGMAYSRTYQRGYMSGRELQRFQEGGNFNPLRQLALMQTEQAGLMRKGEEIIAGSAADKYMKDRQRDLTEAVRTKSITIEMIDQAIAYATSKGGLYYQHQAEQVKTFTGAFSNMIDNLMINAGLATQKLFPIFKSVMNAITNIPFDWMSNAFENIAKAVSYIGYVLVQEGVLDAFNILRGTVAEFFSEVSGGAGELTVFARVLAYTANALLFLLTGVVQVARALAFSYRWLKEHSTVATILGIVLSTFLIPNILKMLVVTRQSVMVFTALGNIMMWLVKSPGLTMSVMMLDIAKNAKLMWAAFAGGGGLATAAIASVAWALYELYNTLQENKALVDNKEYAEGVSRIVAKRTENKRALKQAEAANDLDTRDILIRRIDANDKELSDWKAKFNVPSAQAPMGFDAWSQSSDKLAEQLAQTTAKTNAELEKSNKHLEKIAGNTAKGGLSDEMQRYGNMAWRSNFGTELQHALVEAEG